ncbi:MAG: OadG family protein [Spirochaetaceae bacterium]|nr:OadG family protein [Spirochaetaceae bacterium]
MKKISVLILMIVLYGAAQFLAADGVELVSFNPSWTVHELAASESIPVKQLVLELELKLNEVRGRSLSDLGITRRDAEDAIERYYNGETGMVSSIVAVGMIIVFVSLVVVAFLISLFKHLHIFNGTRSGRRSRSVKTVVETVTSQSDMSDQSIAAVVAAIFLHEEEVDSENRLLLTWKRASTSIWKIGVAMPNSTHISARRGRK